MPSHRPPPKHVITSDQNPRIKQFKKLLSSPKERRDTQTYVIETPRAIDEVLKHHPTHIQTLLHDRPHPLLNKVSHETTDVIEVSPDLFKTLHTLKTSPGILAIAKKPQNKLPQTFKLALYLDELQSPSNMGTIIRNAAAFGCELVICHPHSVDPYHPESVRASAGTLQTITLIENTFETVQIQYPNLTIFTLDSNEGQDLFTLDAIPAESLCIIGSEKGLKVRQNVTPLKIPMKNNVDSLNVATATGILLATLSRLC